MFYVTMRITFNIPEFTRSERNSHCDVLHITPDRVVTLVLDDAIAAIQTSRYRPIVYQNTSIHGQNSLIVLSLFLSNPGEIMLLL